MNTPTLSRLLSIAVGLWVIGTSQSNGQQASGTTREAKVGESWGEASCGVQMSVTTTRGQNSFKLKEPLEISVKVKNVSKATIRNFEAEPEVDFDAFIVSTDGKAYPLKDQDVIDRKDPMSMKLVNQLFELLPGAVREWHFRVDVIYALKDPGAFHLYVERDLTTLSAKAQPCRVKSNAINFVIK